MSIEVQGVFPLFRIFSIEKAKEFYTGFLGFTIDWEHRFHETAPLYMQVSRGGLALHLTEHYGDCCPGSTVFVRMRGIDGLHRELVAKNYDYLHPGIGDEPGIGRCMEVIDPFGNRLRFCEDL